MKVWSLGSGGAVSCGGGQDKHILRDYPLWFSPLIFLQHYSASRWQCREGKARESLRDCFLRAGLTNHGEAG